MNEIKFEPRNRASQSFTVSDDMAAVRTKDGTAAVAQAKDLTALNACPHVGVQILKGAPEQGNLIRRLSAGGKFRSVSPVLLDSAGQAAVTTDNLFVRFRQNVNEKDCLDILNRHALNPKGEFFLGRGIFFAQAREGTGMGVFDAAAELLKDNRVAVCEPEMIRRRAFKTAFQEQWHLRPSQAGGANADAHIGVEAAWNVARGKGVTIAVVDNGFDLGHPEFDGRIRDAARMSPDGPMADEIITRAHGTHCAGVACAAGKNGASGVAPDAMLMPVQITPSDFGQGSIMDECQAILYAVDHGADVISCSWGPPDGVGRMQEAPEQLKTAIRHAVVNGRNGKGCVIVFPAGNGGESVDLDGYASHPSVISAGACNSAGRRASYSDFGSKLWCCFPSDDEGHASIWTTDPRGAKAMNVGNALFGDIDGDYYNGFGGTSCSAAGVAGLAALILSANPELYWHQVKDVIRETCDKIDPLSAQYDSFGHSVLTGYGRVNALAAVRRARSLQSIIQ